MNMEGKNKGNGSEQKRKGEKKKRVLSTAF